MKYVINKDIRPVYQQLYRQIRDDIISENYPYHAKLPSKRSLAEETGVSIITEEHAYALLCDEGYVESRACSGYVVIFRPNEGFAAASQHHTVHKPLQHTDSRYHEFPLSVLSKTMRRVLTDHGELLLEKSPNSGCAELREAIRLLHTTPYRSYPSGVTADASRLHEYIRWSEQQERYIIEDDFESEFSVSTKPTDTLFALSDHDNIIYLNTFSKTISPSLRIGYMVLPKHLVERFHDHLGFYSCTVPTFMQYVLTELINNGDFERHINRVRRSKRKELSEQQ